MKHEDGQVANGSRREFLGSVAVLGGTAAVIAVAGGMARPKAAPRSAAVPAPEAKRSYRLTAHIQTYYDKARF